MKKSNNKENNLFKWATKELSQDAIVAWLLSNKETGLKFVKSLLGEEFAIGYNIEEVETQKKSIDVLVTLKVDEEYHAIIIEDKTNTFLHNNQMLRYIETISKEKYKGKPYSKIYFVLFKTGDVYSWEDEEFDKQKKLLANLLKKQALEAKELNDYFPDTNLIISGSYNKKGIKIYRDNINISIKDIYKIEKFQTFLEELKSDDSLESNDSVFNMVCGFYKKDGKKDNLKLIKEKVYSNVKYFFKNKEKYDYRTIIPMGSGKRDYDICIHKRQYIEYKCENEQLIKPDSKSDNYLILPFIRFKKGKNGALLLEFSVNYNLISNLEKMHGYQSYAEMKKIYGDLTWYENVQNELREKYKSNNDLVKNDKNNQLKFLSWDVEIEKNNINSTLENNLNKLLKYADDMADWLGHMNN